MHDKTGARESAIENEIVRLGTTFGLASKFTSFVAVEVTSALPSVVCLLRRACVPRTYQAHFSC